jgi:hypothetical protein
LFAASTHLPELKSSSAEAKASSAEADPTHPTATAAANIAISANLDFIVFLVSYAYGYVNSALIRTPSISLSASTTDSSSFPPVRAAEPLASEHDITAEDGDAGIAGARSLT